MLPAFIHGLEPQFISIAHSNFIQIKQSGNELTYLSRLSVLLLIAFLFFSVKVHIFWEATKFCKISTLLLSVCTVDKSKVDISQNFVAFSEYMNFTTH